MQVHLKQVQRFLVVLLLGMTIFVFPIFAADSTPSADIKTKLEELKKEIASKAAQLKQAVNLKLKDKTYIGQIKTKTETDITLATDYGPKIVNFNQDTNFDSNIKKKKYSAKLISEEDYVAALGDVDENGVLTAREVVLLPTTDSRPKTYLWGQIAAVSDKLLTIRNRNFKNIAASLQDSTTVKMGDFVILTGSLGKNNFFETDFVYVIPQGGILKPKNKLATPSAKLATPAAKKAN